MDLMEFWFRSRAVIDELVEKFLDESKEWETMEMSKYIMRDGKRFRGTLMFLFNGALGGRRRMLILVPSPLKFSTPPP